MDFTHENGFTEDSLIEVLKVHFDIVKISYGDLSRNNTLKQRISRYFYGSFILKAGYQRPKNSYLAEK